MWTCGTDCDGDLGVMLSKTLLIGRFPFATHHSIQDGYRLSYNSKGNVFFPLCHGHWHIRPPLIFWNSHDTFAVHFVAASPGVLRREMANETSIATPCTKRVSNDFL